MLCALGVGAGSAFGKTKRVVVRGKLDKPGYTVVALGYDGSMTSSHAQSFALAVRASRVTLHLIGPQGAYAGPVVVAARKGRLIVGVKAPARLGRIRVLDGWAQTARPLKAGARDVQRWALAGPEGAPLGNGRNFGFVRSTASGGASGAGGDTDRDGVPDAFDVAASGDLILNVLRPPAGGPLRAAAPPDGGTPGGGDPGGEPPAPSWMSQIFLDIPTTLNANALGVSEDAIDAALVTYLNMKLLNVPPGDLVELDCNGLVYCSPGGTGQVVEEGFPGPGGPTLVTHPFPDCCTSGSSGLGVVRGPGAAPLGGGPGGEELSLDPSTTSARVGSGDTMTLLVTANGTTTQKPLPLVFVFNTVPALAAYADGAGHAGTIVYPAPPDQVGTQSHPAPVGAGADGHVVVTLTWWRPQRRGIAGASEPAFVDIGHLAYKLDVAPQGFVTPNPGAGPQCSFASLSTSDPSLTLVSEQMTPPSGKFVDASDDRPADPANALTATVDLTKCLQDKGASDWPIGEMLDVEIEAASQGSSDHANQKVWFQRVE
ncbi:MAG TPA: hypothetical protein VFD84_14790 [Candidatus Binatia bacterium]|nr:hypothetical protein [Candidatus Binatia bacterium]